MAAGTQDQTALRSDPEVIAGGAYKNGKRIGWAREIRIDSGVEYGVAMRMDYGAAKIPVVVPCDKSGH